MPYENQNEELEEKEDEPDQIGANSKSQSELINSPIIMDKEPNKSGETPPATNSSQPYVNKTTENNETTIHKSYLRRRTRSGKSYYDENETVPESNIKKQLKKPNARKKIELVFNRIFNYIKNSDSPFFKLFFLFLVVCLFFFILYNVLYLFSPSNKPIKYSLLSWKDKQKFFKNEFNKASLKFTSQTEVTFVKLLSAMTRGLEETPQQPSCIVALYPPHMENSKFPACFLRQFGEIFNRAYHSLRPLPIKEMNKGNFEKSVTFVHSELKSYFNQSGRVVLMEGLTELEKDEHIFVFHNFCDNYLAPEKRAVFFFPLEVREELYNEVDWNDKDDFYISDKMLQAAWANVLSYDQIPALIARVSTTVLLLNNGDKC